MNYDENGEKPGPANPGSSESHNHDSPRIPDGDVFTPELLAAKPWLRRMIDWRRIYRVHGCHCDSPVTIAVDAHGRAAAVNAYVEDLHAEPLEIMFETMGELHRLGWTAGDGVNMPAQRRGDDQ